MISVKKQSEDTFEVTVTGAATTTHIVTLPESYYQRLTAGKISAEELIERSFEFLLERESNTSVLSRFELSVISRYFPEYEAEIIRSFS
jgi:hypothetical protein